MEFFGLEGSWKVMSFQPLPPPIQPGLEHFQCIDQAKIKVTHLGNPSFYVPVRPEGGGILGRGHPAGHYLSSLSMAPWILPNSQEFFPWLRQESRWPILHPPEVFNWNKTKGKQIPERTIMSCLHGLERGSHPCIPQVAKSIIHCVFFYFIPSGTHSANQGKSKLGRK